MIKSKLILDIFDLAFDDFRSGDLLRSQIPFLSESDKEHTGVGLFVYFVSDKRIEQFKVDTNNITDFDNERNPIERLDGIEIRNEQLNILADATVHLKNGIIDCLEIWNKNGDNYPKDEPLNYELHQMWLDINKRRTIIK